MTLVRIIKSWSGLDIFRQTPGGKGVWEEVRFTEESLRRSDYVVILNRPPQDTTVCCPPEHVWAIIQEPPNEISSWLHFGDPNFARIYTHDEHRRGERFIHSQPAIPWHVNRSYDALVRCQPPEKTRTLSWITSNKMVVRGQRLRMKFLNSLLGKVELDLFGEGFHYIEDKWDGLAQYKYSLAVENFSNRYYWSEKLADCFLAWTMPIYYGCTGLAEFFPEDSYIPIDITQPDCVERVQEAVNSDAWLRHREAIGYARELVLNRYQLFPFMVGEIQAHQADNPGINHDDREVFLPCLPRGPLNFKEKARKYWRQITPRGLRRSLSTLRRYLEGFR